MNYYDPIAAYLGEWSQTLNTGSVLLRIGIMVLLASVIGCERSSKRHSAGLRTFVLVSFASTVSMILDVYLMSTFSSRLLCHRYCRRADKREFHPVQLPEPDKGAYDVGGAVGVQHTRVCDRGGALHCHAYRFSVSDLHSCLFSVCRSLSEKPLKSL